MASCNPTLTFAAAAMRVAGAAIAEPTPPDDLRLGKRNYLLYLARDGDTKYLELSDGAPGGVRGLDLSRYELDYLKAASAAANGGGVVYAVLGLDAAGKGPFHKLFKLRGAAAEPEEIGRFPSAPGPVANGVNEIHKLGDRLILTSSTQEPRTENVTGGIYVIEGNPSALRRLSTAYGKKVFAFGEEHARCGRQSLLYRPGRKRRRGTLGH